MNATVSIRRATPADRAFVRDLGRRVAATSVSSLRMGEIGDVEAAYDRLVDFVLARDHAIFVADTGERPCGFAFVIFDMPDEVTLLEQAFVAYMAVEPAFARQGIGRDLLHAVEDLARVRRVSHLSLMVTEENVAARTLYDRAGFLTERRLMTKPL